MTNQPLRKAVDPQALEAACTLKAAAVMAETKHLTEARALYQRMLARYSRRAGPTTLTKPTRRWRVFKILPLPSSRSVLTAYRLTASLSLSAIVHFRRIAVAVRRQGARLERTHPSLTGTVGSLPPR
ncbi:MAG: hypothetical protein ABI988_06880 [Nitrospirota bacterium]